MLGFKKCFENLFLAILILFSGIYNASSQSYVKFIVKGKVWTTTIFNGAIGVGPGGCTSGAGPTYFFSNDSLINGLSYTKLCYVSPGYDYFAPNYYGNGPCSGGKPGTVPILFAYLREDTINYKVYKVAPINGIWNEQIFLNFALSKGDSVPYHGGNSLYSSPYPIQNGDTSFFLKVDSVIGTNGHGNIVFAKLTNYDIVNIWTQGVGGISDPSGGYNPQLSEYSQTIASTVVSNKFVIDNGNLVLGLPTSGLSVNDIDFEKINVYNAQGMFLTTLNNRNDFDAFCANPPTNGMMILRISNQNTISSQKVIFKGIE